jgi:hypothetical protein
MNKASNVPPGPSLKGGKNRTRRGGGLFNCVGSRCSRKATVAPEPTTPKTTRYNEMMMELQELGERIMKQTLKTNSSSNNFNSKMADIEVLQKRYDELSNTIYDMFIKPRIGNIEKKANILARPLKTQGGKRKSGRTRRSRK